VSQSRLFILVIVLAGIFSCTGKEPDGSKKDLTQRQRDSVLAETPLPGAEVVGRALEVSDSTAARARRLDEQTE
jgi:hypothetical protein